jgi:hypothetical protein
MKKIFLFLLFFLLILSIFILFYKPYESFENKNQCPNTLIKDGEKILLYNSQLAKIPGVNPIQMDSLNDYEQFIKWQRNNDVECPVLHLDKVFDKNVDMYEINPSYVEKNGRLNHNLPINDTLSSNMNDTTATDIKYMNYMNANLEKEKSNYEYNYYTSELLDESILPNIPYVQLNGFDNSTQETSEASNTQLNLNAQSLNPQTLNAQTLNSPSLNPQYSDINQINSYLTPSAPLTPTSTYSPNLTI